MVGFSGKSGFGGDREPRRQGPAEQVETGVKVAIAQARSASEIVGILRNLQTNLQGTERVIFERALGTNPAGALEAYLQGKTTGVLPRYAGLRAAVASFTTSPDEATETRPNPKRRDK